MKKKFKSFFLIVIILVVLLFAPYLPIELNTNKYKQEVNKLYLQTGLIEDDNYCKVYKYTDSDLQVLFADTKSVNMCYYIKKDDEWKLARWETILSVEGSASGLVFPIYLPKRSGSTQGT